MSRFRSHSQDLAGTSHTGNDHTCYVHLFRFSEHGEARSRVTKSLFPSMTRKNNGGYPTSKLTQQLTRSR